MDCTVEPEKSQLGRVAFTASLFLVVFDTTSSTWRFSDSAKGKGEEREHDDKVEAVLCAEPPDNVHLVRLEVPHVVQLDHAWADVYADEARDVWHLGIVTGVTNPYGSRVGLSRV